MLHAEFIQLRGAEFLRVHQKPLDGIHLRESCRIICNRLRIGDIVGRAHSQVPSVLFHRHDELVIQMGIRLILVDGGRQRKILRRLRLGDGLLPLRDRLLIYLQGKQIKPAVIIRRNPLHGSAQRKIFPVRKRHAGFHLNLLLGILHGGKQKIRAFSGRSCHHRLLRHADRFSFPSLPAQAPEQHRRKQKKDADNKCRAPQDVFAPGQRMPCFAVRSSLPASLGNFFCFRSSFHFLVSCLLRFHPGGLPVYARRSSIFYRTVTHFTIHCNITTARFTIASYVKSPKKSFPAFPDRSYSWWAPSRIPS